MFKWQDKCVLVTGATGLVGSWLVKRLLNEGADVSIFVVEFPQDSELIRSGDIKKCKVYEGDLRNYSDVSKAVQNQNIDFVFHLGAQTIVQDALVEPVYTFEANIMGTVYLFDSIRRFSACSTKVLVASSDKAYGTAETLPYNELTPLRGEGPYDVSKSCTDLLSRSYFLTYDIPTVIARCGNIYGGGDLNWSRIVPGTIQDLINGVQPIIRSNGKFLRDYIYVEDAVDAYLSMASQIDSVEVNGESFNFSRNDPVSVLEIYKATCFATLGEYVEPLIQDSVKNEIIDQHLSNQKASEILRWESKFTLDQGLERTVEWYRRFIDGK